MKKRLILSLSLTAVGFVLVVMAYHNIIMFPSTEGYVLAKNDQRILIASKENTGSTWVSIPWYRKMFNQPELGDKVIAKFRGDVLTSFPAQAKASKIKVLKPLPIEGALLTEEMVLKTVLESSLEDHYTILNRLAFNLENSLWEVQFNVFGNSRKNIIIVDDLTGEIVSVNE